MFFIITFSNLKLLISVNLLVRGGYLCKFPLSRTHLFHIYFKVSKYMLLFNSFWFLLRAEEERNIRSWLVLCQARCAFQLIQSYKRVRKNLFSYTWENLAWPKLSNLLSRTARKRASEGLKPGPSAFVFSVPSGASSPGALSMVSLPTVPRVSGNRCSTIPSGRWMTAAVSASSPPCSSLNHRSLLLTHYSTF